MSKITLTSNQKKLIYTALVQQINDEILLCRIFPCMKEKKSPKLDSRVFHYMVLNKLKYPDRVSVDLCLRDYTNILSIKRCGTCHMCDRESLLHGVFCVCYLRYHEHIPLCINCSGKIERRKNRILELAGTAEYYTIIRKIALINRHLPADMSNIIMYNLGLLYGIFTLANNHFK